MWYSIINVREVSGVWKCTKTELSLTLAETLSMTIIAFLLLVGISPLVGATEAVRKSATVHTNPIMLKNVLHKYSSALPIQ